MSQVLDSILIDNSKRINDVNVFSYLGESESAQFYSKQFSDKTAEEQLVPVVNKNNVPIEMKECISFLKEKLNKDAIVLELGGSRYQHRSGYPYLEFENYFPVDISISSMIAYSKLYNRFAVAADATQLPFKDKSVDAIFSHAFLEHPLDPNAVLSEVYRILKPGGYIIHSDAWNCRWWQRYGIVGIKKFSEISFQEKMIYLAAKFTEFKLIRFPLIIFNRILALLFNNTKNPIHLKYKKLSPNYTLNLYCDEDAASSIDPINVMQFYQSRGVQTIPKLSFTNKLFFRALNIYFQKSR